MRRLRAWAALAVGVALVVLGAAAAVTGGPTDSFEDAPTARDTAGRDAPEQTAPEATDGPESPPANGTGSPAIATRSARIADLATTAPPVGLRVERLGISATVDPVAYDPDGQLEIPEDVRRAGWFRHGPSPGDQSGSAVIAAHVDRRGQRGAFFPLREARPGDTVTVADDGGAEFRYEIVALARYDKEELPITDLFRSGGPHRLVLVTCGGPFDRQTRSYEENVVVIAAPIGDATLD